MASQSLKITDYLAIYAAGLSTVVFIWNVLRSKPKFKVRLCVGMEGREGKALMGIYISILNSSAYTIHLSNVSILYRYKKPSVLQFVSHLIRFRRISRSIGWVHSSLSNYDVKDGCPVSIEAGKAHNIFIPQNVLEKVLESAISREIRAVAQDQLWQNTYSKTLKIDW